MTLKQLAKSLYKLRWNVQTQQYEKHTLTVSDLVAELFSNNEKTSSDYETI